MTQVGRRAPFLALGLLALLAGLWAGLVRLGWAIPVGRPLLPEEHGPLMVLGFLGTLISLERAVALGRRWGYAAPAAAGAGAVLLVAGAPTWAGAALLAAGGLVLMGVFAVAYRMQPARHTVVMWAGAGCWVVAAALWLAGWDVARFVPWLAGFLVLTIVGERLELARMAQLRRGSARMLLAVALLFGAGLVVSVVAPAAGVRVAGVALVLQAAWLARFDVARRTVRSPGLTRYIAACLLAGYAWLAVGGALWAAYGTLTDGPAYDAMLHAVFLGFVMSMVFGHAPIIVPAVLGTAMRFDRSLYTHLVLLHASLLVRLVGGDLLGSLAAWRWGGMFNVVALLVFLGLSVRAVVRAGRRGSIRAAAAVAAPGGERGGGVLSLTDEAPSSPRSRR